MSRTKVLALLLPSILAAAQDPACEQSFAPIPLDATCLDASPVSLLVDSSNDTSSDTFLLVLGDSELCSSRVQCEALCAELNRCDGTESNSLEDLLDCQYKRLTCSSTLWPSGLCGSAVLDSIPASTKAFLPACTFDWFLGNNDALEGIYSGASIFRLAMQTLINDFGFNPASSELVLLGSRGSGAAVLNLAHLLLEENFISDSLQLKLIVDSAWFINYPEFAATEFGNPDLVYRFHSRLKIDSAAWIHEAALDPECKRTMLGLSEENFDAEFAALLVSDEDFVKRALTECLYPSRLMETSSLLGSIQIAFFQNQYDLLMLSEHGVADESKVESFVDTTSFASNAIRFIEQFSLSMRQSFHTSLSTSNANHRVFSPGCSGHSPLFALDYLSFTDKTQKIGSAGEILTSRTAETFRQLSVGNNSLPNFINAFLSGDESTSPRIISTCGSFSCEDSCSLDVLPFVVSQRTSSGGQFVIIIVALAIILSGWAGFLLVALNVTWFQSACKFEWRRVHKTGSDSAEIAAEALIKEAQLDQKQVCLMLKNLSYFSPPKVPGERYAEILRQVSICAKPGEVHALMGPSGSGKTTLLDILAQTRQKGRFSGVHSINGVSSHPKKSAFLRQWLRNNMSYVRQQDVLFPKLTVREHLTHAAFLMLPESMTRKEKLMRVERVATMLGLKHVLDVKCGDGGVRIEGGISGGQRRRVSVATQMLKLPAAIVLDEPTSGLDSTSALALINVLHKLAHEAKICVILTIHQPRREILSMIDKLSILVKGSVVFSGAPAEAAHFFRLDLQEVNIGDDILDKLEELRENERALKNISRIYKRGNYGKAVEADIHSEESSLTGKMRFELEKLLRMGAKDRYSWTKATSTRSTVKILMSRTFLRGGFDIVRTLGVAFFGGVLVGTVFIGNESYAVGTALAYLIIATMTFLQATFLGDRYQLEKGMWSHERDAGLDVSWVAFLLSIFLRNIVTSTLEGLAFALPVYFMGGLNLDKPERLPLFLILLVLVAIAVISQNTLVEIDRIRRGGISGPDLRAAALINMTLLSIGALFNGFIIPLDQIPSALQWVPYCMVTFWGFVGILVNNYRDFAYDCDRTVLECATETGDNYIREFKYTDFDVFECIIALCGMVVIFHALSIADFFLRFVRSSATLKKVRAEEDEEDEEADAPETVDNSKGFVGRTMKEVIAGGAEEYSKSKRGASFLRLGKSRKQGQVSL